MYWNPFTTVLARAEGFCTTTLTKPRLPGGVTQRIRPADSRTSCSQRCPPISTVTPARKKAPLTMIGVPPARAPLFGEIDTTLAAVLSTFQVRDAGATESAVAVSVPPPTTVPRTYKPVIALSASNSTVVSEQLTSEKASIGTPDWVNAREVVVANGDAFPNSSCTLIEKGPTQSFKMMVDVPAESNASLKGALGLTSISTCAAAKTVELATTIVFSAILFLKYTVA